MISFDSLNHALNGKVAHREKYRQQTKSLIVTLLRQSGFTEPEINSISLDAIDGFTDIARLDYFVKELQDFAKFIKKDKTITSAQQHASLSRIIENADKFTTVILEEMAWLTDASIKLAKSTGEKYLAARQERLASQAAAAKAEQARLTAEAEKEQAKQRAQEAERQAQEAEQRAQEVERQAREAKQARLAAEAELAKFKEMFTKTQQPAGTASTVSSMPLDTPVIAQTSSLPTTSSRPKRKLSSQADATSSTASNPSRLLARAATLATNLPDSKKAKIQKPAKASTSTPSAPPPRKQ